MKLLDFAIVKLAFWLIAGILVGYYLTISLDVSLLLSITLVILLFVIYQTSLRAFKPTVWFGLVSYLAMLSLGILTVNIHNQKLYKNHYTSIYDFSKTSTSNIYVTIREVLKPNTYNARYIAKINRIDTTKVVGKILLNIALDSSENTLNVDDKLIINANLQNLKPPKNPDQFNYKAYLKKQYVYAQIYSDNNHTLIISHNTFSNLGYANKVRLFVNKKLETFDFSKNELAVINALLLGQRQNIDKALYQDYANAGAIHILAISGLHIGIILFMLEFLFSFLNKGKHGKLIKAFLIVTILWLFAIIAGLSPSVVRAVTMFTAVAIAINLNRPHNIFNTLAISVFVLLLFKPMFLFEVGFQMSYLAVIGIVTIQPLLYNPIKTRFWLPNKVFNYATVSIAAQIGVLPISLYYFHQFPGLFLLTNMVIIPFLGFILGYGFIVMIMATLNIPKNIITNFYGDIIDAMNLFFKWVAQQESFLFKDISINGILLFVCYLLIIAFVRYLTIKTFKRLVICLIAIILFQSTLIFNKFQHETSDEYIIFQKSKQSVLGFQKGKQLYIYSNLKPPITKETMLTKYAVSNFITTVKADSLKNVYSINNKTLLVIDSLNTYQIKSFKADYLLLRNSPKIHLKRVIDSLKPKTIIADGSNYKSYVTRWEETCRKEKLPFHSTYEKGAYIFKLD
ncbi:ComEC/Rec2 family competence protein [Corallibacter sp.]|uniref:ComEC/Rec2 family competence protein n=1 Tax=Corallibacter sp. TaxID=2038084 RepID=UPI003A913FB8